VAEIVSLATAVERTIHDGDTVAMEGFTHLIPHAAGREVMRQRLRDLTLVRMTPDVIYDQLIGAGCASKLVFSWGGNPGVGSLHRFRDAIENSWPVPLDIEEHSHAGMANRYAAGAAGLPFAVLRGYRGTGLAGLTENISEITCPFTGERLTAVAALTPDVAVVHAQRADRAGNVQFWGITGVQKEAAGGQRTTVDVLNSEADLISAKARLIGAQRDRVIASYTLLSAVGRLDVAQRERQPVDHLARHRPGDRGHDGGNGGDGRVGIHGGGRRALQRHPRRVLRRPGVAGGGDRRASQRRQGEPRRRPRRWLWLGAQAR